MAAEKATAIVLRLVEFSETSSVVTLFTEEFGRVAVLAKGARRAKNAFDSALDLLTVCRLVFLRKSSGGLDLLTEAKLVRRFRPSGRDLAPLYAGYYVAELLLNLVDDYDPHPELFRATDGTLARLCSGQDVPATVLRFELTALRLLGHLPSLSLCVECGEPVAAEGRIAFGQLAGGVLCRSCRPGKRHVVSISAAVLNVLRAMASERETGRQDAQLDSQVQGELRGVMNHYISHLLGKKLKLQPLLGFLASPQR